MKKLTVTFFFLLGAFVALFAPHCASAPERQPLESHRLGLGAGVRGWLDVPLAQARYLWALQRAIDTRAPCPEQPADGAVLTYAQGCPTHFGDRYNTLAPPSAWTYHVGSKPFQSAPGLYSFALVGPEANLYTTIRTRCTALQEAGAAPQECAGILAMPALVTDAVHLANVAAAKAEAGGAERVLDDAGESDPPDDYADAAPL